MLLRLLIVDDDESLAGTLKSFFERHKYKVEMAHDGRKAVEAVDHFKPHLMFLDIGLPGISGIEVLRQVKEKDPSVRVIMITGQTEDELMRQARILGADDYVTKPFTLDYLSGEVLDKLHNQLFYELRSASAELTIEREKAELLFEQVQEGVILFDPQGLVFLANPAAQQLLGLVGNTSSLGAQQVFKGFQGQSPSQLDNLATLAENGKPFDLVRDNANARTLILECRVSSILTRSKQSFGYLFLFRDVTMERKADSAMHRFISLVSHKLRTPLVAIRAYPKLLLSENAIHPLNDFQRNALQVIAKQCQQLEDMVNQLIAFSSLDPEELLKQPMAVLELLQESTKLLPETMKEKGQQIKYDAHLQDFQVQVDPTLLQHALRNILENAFKFGASEVRVNAKRTNGTVTLCIADNGPGIPPEDRERVFERFYQVEKSFSGQVPGAGLGLTMVKQTVEAHGGQVWVESDIGKGSSFFIKLPAAA